MSRIELSDDIANLNLGKNWRIPTKDEWGELKDLCTWEWTDNYKDTGVKGYIVSGKNKYKNKSIFLPAAGYRAGTELKNEGTVGCYWSSDLEEVYLFEGSCLCINNKERTIESYPRCSGLSIRPVVKF